MTYRYRQIIEEGGGLTWLRKKHKLTPSELFVLDNLIKHDHPQNGCFPKQETIAHETGLYVTNVGRALNGLVAKGLVESWKPATYVAPDGRIRQNKIKRYRFNDPVQSACERAWEEWGAAKDSTESQLALELEQPAGSSLAAAFDDSPKHNSGGGHNTIAEVEQHNSGGGHNTIAEVGHNTIAEVRSSNIEVGSRSSKDFDQKDSLTAGAARQNLKEFGANAVQNGQNQEQPPRTVLVSKGVIADNDTDELVFNTLEIPEIPDKKAPAADFGRVAYRTHRFYWDMLEDCHIGERSEVVTRAALDYSVPELITGKPVGSLEDNQAALRKLFKESTVAAPMEVGHA